MKMAKMGIFFDQDEAEKRWSRGQNVFEGYLFEIFDHLRIPYERVSAGDSLESYDIIVESLSGDSHGNLFFNYVESGGTLVSYGGLECLRERLGFIAAESEQTGYAFIPPCIPGEYPPLRFLASEIWADEGSSSVWITRGKLGTANDHCNFSAPACLHEFPLGEGKIYRWGVKIPQTIAGLQQGTLPVYEDGSPAPDGTANLDEGLLKADDGFELDWVMDRSFTETGIPYFPYPYADLWREAVVGNLLSILSMKGLTVPMLDYWPADIKHMAMISHDSDLNGDECALITLEALKEEDVQTTWCMIAPGYSPAVYEKIKEDGHEIALHYNALHQDDGIWSEKAFSEQLKWIQDASATVEIVSNKNHYTLFEGWGELFEWCEKHGIQADQTRGPSKKGNIGFLFGTSHPYFPAAWANEKNRLYDVLEIGFLTQDLNHHALADTSVIQPFLDGVKRVGGVAHFLFHQHHIYNQPKVRQAITELIRTAKSQEFTFWTCARINQWERDRRKVSLLDLSGGMHIGGAVKSEGFSVLVPLEADTGEGNRAGGEDIVTRFGFHCRRILPVSYLAEG
ncbi:hypothetical protein ABXS71_20210 [Bacillus infantis]|jgi:hypothetical protein|uniref:hypothetical protein n=1 Tax=Bacillus infantis TaxID=324767 RepID=UPI00344DB0D2